jgi:hypothetical protein
VGQLAPAGQAAPRAAVLPGYDLFGRFPRARPRRSFWLPGDRLARGPASQTRQVACRERSRAAESPSQTRPKRPKMTWLAKFWKNLKNIFPTDQLSTQLAILRATLRVTLNITSYITDLASMQNKIASKRLMKSNGLGKMNSPYVPPLMGPACHTHVQGDS